MGMPAGCESAWSGPKRPWAVRRFSRRRRITCSLCQMAAGSDRCPPVRCQDGAASACRGSRGRALGGKGEPRRAGNQRGPGIFPLGFWCPACSGALLVLVPGMIFLHAAGQSLFFLLLPAAGVCSSTLREEEEKTARRESRESGSKRIRRRFLPPIETRWPSAISAGRTCRAVRRLKAGSANRRAAL